MSKYNFLSKSLLGVLVTINMGWDFPPAFEKSISHFDVLRAVDGGSRWIRIGKNLPPSTRLFSDKRAAMGRQMCYMVSSIRGGVTLGLSNELCIIPEIPTPSNLRELK